MGESQSQRVSVPSGDVGGTHFSKSDQVSSAGLGTIGVNGGI